ncbi:PspC domain-containing protein [Paenibacillus turicensis]|uniref:PspC domain-containing protein n=1 Tax=Paenibacillus turicensis TaxID=160487 RepID=UPI003D2CD7D7
MKKLYRSRTDKKVSGLCGGLSIYFNIDASIVRLVIAVVMLLSFGTVLLLYIIASIIIPKEPYGSNSNNHNL